jgi:hypothetical protein
MTELSRQLSLRTPDVSELSGEDARRLEALGYITPDTQAPE